MAAEHLFNYLSRFAIPYVVPHMVAEFGFTDAQRSAILNSFTPGYILTQIPAAPLCGKIGAKTVLSLNNIGLLSSLIALPIAAKQGARAVWFCIALMGIMQGPFIVAQGAMTSAWSIAGPERPVAVFIIRLGGNIAKLVASAVTPLLCSTRWGWRSVCYVYGGVLALYCVTWNIFARNSPPPLPPSHSPSTPKSDENSTEGGSPDGGKPKSKEKGKGKGGTTPREFELIGCATKPSLAIIAIQVAHALCEFNIVGAWAPTYFTEVLGVPLNRLGFFTSVPMMLGIASKSIIAAWESAMLSKGTYSQLALRKIATTVGSAIACVSLVMFDATRSSFIATLAYCGIVFGNSFDYSGFLPNYIEVAGNDPAGTFIAWVNTLAWAGAFVSTEIINRLSMLSGTRSWRTLWLAPVVCRIAATAIYAAWASTRPAMDLIDEAQERRNKRKNDA